MLKTESLLMITWDASANSTLETDLQNILCT